jgi:site-specific DNA recombinase
VRAVIYCRISKDDEDMQLGVQRQEEDCRRLAKDRGWQVVAVYTDNDISASTRSRKPRPKFDQLIKDAKDGHFKVVIAYSSSRLTRRPLEHEGLINLAEQHGTRFRFVRSPSFDLNTADGRNVARILAANDAAESERISERVARKLESKRSNGESHGRPAYGWRRDELEPQAAAVIRESVERLLLGDSLGTITRDLNSHGEPAPEGGRWSAEILAHLIKRPRNAGILTYKGKEIGPGKWPAIVTEDAWRRAMERLGRNPAPTERARKHLLTGIAVCGRCGEKMRSIPGKGKGKDYSCPGCYLRRRMETVDRVVEAVVIERLSQPDATAVLSDGASQAEVREAWDAVEALRARRRRLADIYAEGGISEDQLVTGTAKINPKLEAAEERARSLSGKPDLLDLTGDDVAAKWTAASLERKRAVIDSLMIVKIVPMGRGKRSASAGVEVVPKGRVRPVWE